MRLKRLRTTDWSAVWEFSFQPGGDDWWFSDGFFLVDVDGGCLLTAATDVDRGEIVFSVGNLHARKTVKVVVPMDPFNVGRMKWGILKRPGIYLRYGKVLLIYDDPQGSESMFLLMDAWIKGKKLWSAIVQTKVFLGIGEENDPITKCFRKRLEPVFNEHYVTFLNTYPGTLAVCRFISHDPTGELDCFATDLMVDEKTLHFDTDSCGRIIAAGHRLSTDKGTHHRVTLVDAVTGDLVQDYDMVLPGQHHSLYDSDLEFHLSVDNTQLIMYGSSHDDDYRTHTLGHIKAFDLVRTTSNAHIRTLHAPVTKSAIPLSSKTTFNLELCALTTRSHNHELQFLSYKPLQLPSLLLRSSATNSFNSTTSNSDPILPASHSHLSLDKSEIHLHTILSKSWLCVFSSPPSSSLFLHPSKQSQEQQQQQTTTIIRLYAIGDSPGTDFSASQTPSRSQTPSALHSANGITYNNNKLPNNDNSNNYHHRSGSLSPHPFPVQRDWEMDKAQERATLHAQMLAEALEMEKRRIDKVGRDGDRAHSNSRKSRYSKYKLYDTPSPMSERLSFDDDRLYIDTNNNNNNTKNYAAAEKHAEMADTTTTTTNTTIRPSSGIRKLFTRANGGHAIVDHSHNDLGHHQQRGAKSPGGWSVGEVEDVYQLNDGIERDHNGQSFYSYNESVNVVVVPRGGGGIIATTSQEMKKDKGKKSVMHVQQHGIDDVGVGGGGEKEKSKGNKWKKLLRFGGKN